MSHEDLARQLMALDHTEESLEAYWADFADKFLIFLGVMVDKATMQRIVSDLKTEMPSVIDVAVPIYTHNFSRQELIALIEYRSSPVIEKMSRIRPQLKMEVATTMGHLSNPEILTRILDRHIGAGKGKERK